MDHVLEWCDGESVIGGVVGKGPGQRHTGSCRWRVISVVRQKSGSSIGRAGREREREREKRQPSCQCLNVTPTGC